MSLTLEAIRACLDGDIPATIATVANDGMPNVAMLSQVQYVDAGHVALSYQFFNKTRQNILANPFAQVEVMNPATGSTWQLSLRYLRTETQGALFENMKAKLAGIASHTGMQGVFRLLGSDIYEVLAIQQVPGATVPQPPQPNLLSATRASAGRLAQGGDMEALLDRLLDDLKNHFGIAHAMVLMADAAAGRLYTVASLGYEKSGVGSEIPFGAGVIGVAARERTPIRITHFAADYIYSRAVAESGGPCALERQIPLPGLAQPHSQLAVPILAGGTLLGVLFAESGQALRFGYDEEDALAVLAAGLGLALQAATSANEETATGAAHAAPPTGAPVLIRHYEPDDSVFIDNDYLIKGVAGAIFWKLMRDYAGGRRSEFSNRELRLEASLRLPALAENLEARLILLQRRLAERCDFLAMEKTGRGRFCLNVRRPVRLVEMPGGES